MPRTPKISGDYSPARSRAKTQTRSARAGLTIPVGKIHRVLKNGNYAARIGTGAAVNMAAALQYLVREVLDLAVQAAKDNQKTRVSPRHIMLVVRHDEELNQLLDRVIIAHSGVRPHIEPMLFPKNTNSKPTNKSNSSTQE